MGDVVSFVVNQAARQSAAEVRMAVAISVLKEAMESQEQIAEGLLQAVGATYTGGGQLASPAPPPGLNIELLG